MHGHGQEHLKILLRSSAIQKRVREMGFQISKDYKGQRVHLIGVLKGAAIFLSDLIRHIRVEVSLDFMSVSSYGHGSQTSGQVRLNKDLDTSIEGLNVIVVEDILDTGLTLGYLLRVLQQRKPNSLKIEWWAIVTPDPLRQWRFSRTGVRNSDSTRWSSLSLMICKLAPSELSRKRWPDDPLPVAQ